MQPREPMRIIPMDDETPPGCYARALITAIVMVAIIAVVAFWPCC